MQCSFTPQEGLLRYQLLCLVIMYTSYPYTWFEEHGYLHAIQNSSADRG
jgi:hypothetical protein